MPPRCCRAEMAAGLRREMHRRRLARRRTWETAYIYASMKHCEEVHLVVFHSANEVSGLFGRYIYEMDDSNKPMGQYAQTRDKFADWLSIYGKLKSLQQTERLGSSQKGGWLAPSLQSSLIKLFSGNNQAFPKVTVSLYSHAGSSFEATSERITEGAASFAKVAKAAVGNDDGGAVAAVNNEELEVWWTRMKGLSPDGAQWRAQVRTRCPRAPSSHEPRAREPRARAPSLSQMDSAKGVYMVNHGSCIEKILAPGLYLGNGGKVRAWPRALAPPWPTAPCTRPAPAAAALDARAHAGQARVARGANPKFEIEETGYGKPVYGASGLLKVLRRRPRDAGHRHVYT